MMLYSFSERGAKIRIFNHAVVSFRAVRAFLPQSVIIILPLSTSPFEDLHMVAAVGKLGQE